MDLWLSERYRDAGVEFRVTKTLFHSVSEFQTVDIVETAAYGRMLLLDGAIMTTEKDEFVYHEMISHIPLLAHPNPKQVLVIGGGDGGTIREVLKHPSVERAVLCEIDGMVIDASREYLPTIAGKLGDPRVDIQVRDGAAYIRDHANTFDVILIDSSDPEGPALSLFNEAFYTDAKNALTENGILTAQTGSALSQAQEVRDTYRMLRKVFPQVQAYTGCVATYPGHQWTWSFCSKGVKPLESINEALAKEIEKTTQYYNRDVHKAAFALPNYVQELTQSGVTASC